MIIIYLIFGFLVSAIGALPLGAVNIAVINTTLKEDYKKAFRISLAAGLGEIVLALLALHFSLELTEFFEDNQWIQITITTVFLIVGTYFILRKSISSQSKKLDKIKPRKSRFFTGFSLAILNPPVILYWILAISFTNRYIFQLTQNTSLSALLLFFSGIYLGKISILFLYSQWSNRMAQKSDEAKAKLFKIIGAALIVISFVQVVKLFVI